MYKKVDLDNGLQIVAHDMKGRDSVSLGIWIGVGGRYESDQLKGAAHFLEHVLFKGSKKYSCDQIKANIEGVGGSINAFTSEEITCYYAKTPAKHSSKTFDILFDMASQPLISNKDVDKERGVILEEIKMYNDLPQYLVVDLLDSLLWPGHPLGKSLTGTYESVSKISTENLEDFHKKYYIPNAMIVSACGNIRIKDLEYWVQQKAAKMKKALPVNYILALNIQNNPRVKYLHKDIEQVHLALGMLGLNATSKDRYALGLLNIILGGNMSSRLYNEVREKRGLAYSIGSSLKFLHDTGALVVRAGVDAQKSVQAVEVVIAELKKIKKYGVPIKEFQRAKEYYMGQVLLGLEDTLEHMLWIGESGMMLGRIRTLAEIVESVRLIKMKEVLRMANLIFDTRKFNLAVVGPIADKQKDALDHLIGI